MPDKPIPSNKGAHLMKEYIVGGIVGYVLHDKISEQLSKVMPKDVAGKPMLDNQTAVIGGVAAAWYFQPGGENTTKYLIGAGAGYLVKDMKLIGA